MTDIDNNQIQFKIAVILSQGNNIISEHCDTGKVKKPSGKDEESYTYDLTQFHHEKNKNRLQQPETVSI